MNKKEALLGEFKKKEQEGTLAEQSAWTDARLAIVRNENDIVRTIEYIHNQIARFENKQTLNHNELETAYVKKILEAYKVILQFLYAKAVEE